MCNMLLTILLAQPPFKITNDILVHEVQSDVFDRDYQTLEKLCQR